jgi:predicted hydrolase (HD superfamily)
MVMKKIKNRSISNPVIEQSKALKYKKESKLFPLINKNDPLSLIERYIPNKKVNYKTNNKSFHLDGNQIEFQKERYRIPY